MKVGLISIKGRVQVQKAGTFQWLDATTELALEKDDLVQTGRSATAEIQFADGTRFNVRPDSLIVIVKSIRDPLSNEPSLDVRTESGETHFHTPPQPGKRSFDAPASQTTAKGGSAGSIKVAPDGKTAVRIFDGEGEVQTRTDQRVTLGARQGVQIDPAGRAGPTVALPAAPTLTAPEDQAEARLAEPPAVSMVLAWSAVGGARGYRVVVESDALAQPSIERYVDDATRLALERLDAGVYRWSVAAIGANGAEGGFAPARSFSLVGARAPMSLPPQLSLDLVELRGAQLHIKGRTERGVTLTINGERVPVQSDGSFDEHLALEKGAATVSIRVAAANGAVTEQHLPIKATN